MTWGIAIVLAAVLLFALLILFIALRYHEARQRRIKLALKQGNQNPPVEKISPTNTTGETFRESDER